MSVVRHSLRRLTAQGIASFTRPAVRHLATITTSGKTHDVLLFKGDGIGPEITTAAVNVLNATGVRINWHEMDVGFEASKRTGHVITEEHLQAFDKYRVILKGPLTIPPAATNTYVHLRDRKFTSANQVFRKLFHLYANVRPAKTLPGIKTPFSNVDQVIIRENTEDVYTGEEKWVDKDTVEGIKRITRGASTRISKFAFEYAVTNQRKLVTAVHKANVCKQADGLFVSCATETAKLYPQIKFNTQLADSLLTRMVQAPEEFDVLLCPNLYGDLVSDLAAGLIGSLGLMPAGQFGDNHALFEPAHGSAPDIAGRGEANPVSMIRSAVMMLQHLGEHDAAKRVERAVCDIIAEGKHVTADLGGKSTTTQMTKAIIDRL